MAAFTRFEDIEAWQKGRILARELFRTLKEPQFRVVSQFDLGRL